MLRTGNHQVDKQDMLGNALKGVIAGAIGVWVMDRLDWFMFRHEDQQARRRTEQVRPGGMDPAHAAVDKIAHALGTEVHPKKENPFGMAMHYAIGIGPAAAYGVLRNRLPPSPQGRDYLYGAGLGLGLFLIQDEGLNQVMGISAKQKDYPWQAHARGLIAHLSLGLVTNAMLNLLNAPRPSGSRTFRTEQYPVQGIDRSFMPTPRRSSTQGAAHPL